MATPGGNLIYDTNTLGGDRAKFETSNDVSARSILSGHYYGGL